MYLPLTRDFYERDTVTVAKNLLGKYLIRKIQNEFLVGIIIEVEAYLAFGDEAAHNYIGRTKRTEVLFGEAGHTYIHAMRQYFCMDIVTEGMNIPGSVLIRSIQPIQRIEAMENLRHMKMNNNFSNGPGKVCQALAISKEQNGLDITRRNSLLIISEGNGEYIGKQIQSSKRIGITKAADKILRFYL